MPRPVQLARLGASYEVLVDVLTAIGKPPQLCGSPDGTRVLVLPSGGRILGLFPPRSDENFYWTHPELATVKSARALFEGEQWHNPGGDRTWLSPEIDLFFPDISALDKYWQPRSLDPGNYQVVRAGDRIQLVNRLTVTLSRSKQTVEAVIGKSISPAPQPLRFERDLAEQERVQYAGYTLHTSLELLAKPPAGTVGLALWNLAQMPHGGEMLVPTHFKSVPTVWFGTLAQEDLLVSDHLVRHRTRACGNHKIGIRAVASTGRAGYIYSDGHELALVVRNFSVNPSGEYVDVPWNDPGDLGYSVQTCNVNGALGSFSELEYHAPAIGFGTVPERCEDESQVWAFRGSEEAIRAIARRLLSSEV